MAKQCLILEDEALSGQSDDKIATGDDINDGDQPTADTLNHLTTLNTVNNSDVLDNLGTPDMPSPSQALDEQISTNMALLKARTQLLTLQFHELSHLSSRLMQQLRQLQMSSSDDYSITYEQMSDLRQHLVAIKQDSTKLSDLIDVVEDALESERYVAQLRHKR